MTERIGERGVPIDMSADEFRSLAHALVEALSDFREGLPQRRSALPLPP